MGKTTQVMSLSVAPSLIESLDEAAAKRGHSNRSKLACELFEDFKDLAVETHAALRQVAEQRGVSVAELVEFLLAKFPLNDTSVKPIVLRIPVDIADDRDKLEVWLSQKVTVLVNHLHPQ
jgi:hypothetical protein